MQSVSAGKEQEIDAADRLRQGKKGGDRSLPAPIATLRAADDPENFAPGIAADDREPNGGSPTAASHRLQGDGMPFIVVFPSFVAGCGIIPAIDGFHISQILTDYLSYGDSLRRGAIPADQCPEMQGEDLRAEALLGAESGALP